jgi:type I restriction enzyme, S subunit
MNTYSSYKDCGVEWIGDIPSEWEVKRIDHFFIQRKDKVDDTTYPPLSVTMKGIKNQLEGVAKSDDSSNRKLVLKNDFVINSRSDRKGSSGISFRDGSVSLINTVLEPKNINPNYVEYLLKSHYFIEEYFRFGKGIHFDLWSTNYSLMKNIKIPVLSIKEQKKISEYLDYKTSRIVKLIKKTEQKIELLKEQRLSLIKTTVTKGLKFNIKMKDSGVEWIGKIPSEWKMIRIGFMSSLLTGFPFKSDRFSESGTKILRGENVSEGFLRWGDRTRCWNLEYKNKYILLENDIVIGMDGSKVGKNYIKLTKEDLPLLIHQRMCRLRLFSGFHPSFLSYHIMSDMFRHYITISKTDPMIPHITQKNISDYKVSVPLFQEQQQIVDYLDKETSKIAKLINIESKRIELLKEYRQSLISDVVTGKVDVRDEVLV